MTDWSAVCVFGIILEINTAKQKNMYLKADWIHKTWSIYTRSQHAIFFYDKSHDKELWSLAGNFSPIPNIRVLAAWVGGKTRKTGVVLWHVTKQRLTLNNSKFFPHYE